MTANINSETGIAYGVVNGNTVPMLADDIFSSGDSTTFAAYKSEMENDIRAALASVVEERTGKDRTARIVEAIDCAELVDSILDSGLNDSLEFDEEEYDYETDGAKLHLGWLGGAPLIWVLDSPFVTYAPVCSPCVPNAGDLDNLSTDGTTGGVLCYCCPPDCFDTEDESADTFEVSGETEINGRTYKIVRKIEASDDEESDDEGGE
jgi:hypothetical protein